MENSYTSETEYFRIVDEVKPMEYNTMCVGAASSPIDNGRIVWS